MRKNTYSLPKFIGVILKKSVFTRLILSAFKYLMVFAQSGGILGYKNLSN
jgi:hypothetical protein